MSTKEHYDNHLANIYSWMAGDFNSKVREFVELLDKSSIDPTSSKTALDLGAGHGIQSVALAKKGFEVTAIDFNQELLEELKQNSTDLAVNPIIGDILDTNLYADLNPEVITCCGDTLLHVNSKNEVANLIANCAEILRPTGKMILSFRDYSLAISGDQFFIPVKSDSNRILTCILNYEKDKVKVTDLIHEKNNNEWTQKVSSYYKIIIAPKEVERLLLDKNKKIILNESKNGMTTIVTTKIN